MHRPTECRHDGIISTFPIVLIVNYLKALIASDTLGRETYYQVANTDDTTVQRALRELTEGRATAPITAGTDSLGVHPVRQGGK